AEDPAAAEPVLREGLVELEKSADKNPGALADLLSTLSLSQGRNANPHVSRETVQRALDYATQSDGPEGIRVGQSHYALAEIEMRLGHFDEAEKHAKRGIEILRSRTSE